MSFRQKLGLILSLVGLAPIAVVGVLSYRASRDEVRAQVQTRQGQIAEGFAREAETTIGHAAHALTLSIEALPLATFMPDELSAVLKIPYRQLADVTAIALLDEEGDAVVPPVFEAGERRPPPALDQMASRVPFDQARAIGTAIGPPYRLPSGEPRVVLAVRSGRFVVAAELSLRALVRRAETFAAKGERLAVVDAKGLPLIQAGTATGPELTATAPVNELGWTVVAARPEAVALRAAARVRDYSLVFGALGVVLALALSAWIARGVSRPVAELSKAAKAVSAGSYDVHLQIPGSDELAELGKTFTQMAAEIAAWNRELQTRVEARTAELKAAQDQILRTRRLAALGSMGAGLAHELNNPLAAVIGLAGLTQMTLPPGSKESETLAEVVKQGQRMAQIVERLRAQTDAEREGAGRPFALAEPVHEALAAFAPRLSEKRIVLRTELDARVPEVRGRPEAICEVVGHLVENAITAMPDGGTLTVAIAPLDGALKLTVADTGRGIPKESLERIFDPFFTTKGDPNGVGLGLSTSHRIVQQHHGTIAVSSEPGKGSTLTVLLPAAGDAPHLA